MDAIGLRLMFVIGLIALAGLAMLAGPLISALGARWRSHRDATGRGMTTRAGGGAGDDDARHRALQFRQMLWRSLL